MIGVRLPDTGTKSLFPTKSTNRIWSARSHLLIQNQIIFSSKWNRRSMKLTTHPNSFYRVSIKYFSGYKYLLQENNYTWNTNFFFQDITQEVFLCNTSVHFNICSFCCTENVYAIIDFSPRVLQYVFSYCSKSVCYSCLQICNIWNWCRKHFVLNIPP